MTPDEGSASGFEFTRDEDRALPANDFEPFTEFDPLSLAAPELSARAGVTPQQRRALAACAILACAAALAFPLVFSQSLICISAIVFAALIALRWAAAFAPAAKEQDFPQPDILPVYSILCPVYREAGALPGLVAALDALHYPRKLLDVSILAEAGDWPTLCAADEAAQTRPWLRTMIVPPEGPRTKPKALNMGLAQACGDLLVVFDAEDRPHPDQLRAAAAAFATGGAYLACVQAPLRVYNAADSWIAGQFALEYSVQFGKLLPLFAKFRWPILLGGTSNHFRTAILRASHGWDSYNVTEDADLGLRLARAGLRTGLIAPPTFEEAPITLAAWRRQRTRWIKGHLMTWLVHMRRPSLMLRQLGPWGFIGAHLTLGGGLLSSLAHGPLLLMAIWALAGGRELGAASALACAGYVGAFLCAMRAPCADGWRVKMWPALTAPLYWPLQSWAAFLALIDLIRAPHRWAKTEHGLTTAAAPQIASPALDALQSADEMSAL